VNLRTFRLEGNVGNTSTKKTEIPAVDSTSEDECENSKVVYLNDSYELDTIPLDVETIIDINDNEETY
jgi:hypothetical protein